MVLGVASLAGCILPGLDDLQWRGPDAEPGTAETDASALGSGSDASQPADGRSPDNGGADGSKVDAGGKEHAGTGDGGAADGAVGPPDDASVPACRCAVPNTHCDPISNLCVANKTCADLGTTGSVGAFCSDGPAFDGGGGSLLACGCTAPGSVCSKDGKRVAGSAQGVCCVNTAACEADACGIHVVNSCTGEEIPCAAQCPIANTHCDPASKKCVANATCETFGANGEIDQPCSIAASSAFPDGAGGALTCDCLQNATTDNYCSKPSASAPGICRACGKPGSCAEILLCRSSCADASCADECVRAAKRGARNEFKAYNDCARARGCGLLDFFCTTLYCSDELYVCRP